MGESQEMAQMPTQPKVAASHGLTHIKPKAMSDSEDNRSSSGVRIKGYREKDDSDLSDYDQVSDPGDIKAEGVRRRRSRESAKPMSSQRNKLTKPSQHDEKERPKEHRDLDYLYSELQTDYKVMQRDHRELIAEVRELRHKNSQLKDAYHRLRAEAMEDPRKFGKSEKNRYQEHYQVMENHIHFLANEVEKRDAHIEMLTKQTRDANLGKDELEETNRKLQRQIKELNTNLTECKDDLLRLQPPSQMADSEIGDRYSNLCQQITSWVDDQTEDSEALEQRFEKLRTPESLNMDPILNAYLDDNHLSLLHEHSDVVPFVVQYLIHCCLEEYVMGNGIYFYGLDIRNTNLLQEVELGMKLLEPQRDAVTLRRWRSEALLGLSKSPGFSTERSQQVQTLAKTLYFAIVRFLRGSPGAEADEKGWELFHTQIVLPAVELATFMRLSMSDYELVLNFSGSRNLGVHGEKVAHHSEIQHYEMIDVASRKVIRPDSVLKVGEDGRIGRDVLTFTPALMRTRNDGVHRNILAKPMILVKLDEPMGKRSKGLKSLGAWTAGWLGGETSLLD